MLIQRPSSYNSRVSSNRCFKSTVLESMKEEATYVAACYKGKNALVTGGFGFVGSHLTRALLALGANVTVFDIRTETGVESLLNDPSYHLRDNVTIVRGDLADRHAVFETISRGNFSFVFNFAAYATVIEKATENPYDTIQANTIGVVNLLESARQLKAQSPRILHASTDKVYGEMDGGAYEEEKTPLRGIGVYDSTKLAADLFARMYHEVYGLPTVVLRMCNIFGPADFNTCHRLIPKAMRSIYACKEPTGPELYFDSIEHWRDYLYIDDCVRAILLAAFRRECLGEVFNLTATNFISTPELLRTIVHVASEVEREFDASRAEAILSSGISVRVRCNAPGVVTIKKQHLNGGKLKRVTGFEPTISFSDGIERTIRAYREYYLSRKSRCRGHGTDVLA